MQSKEDKCNLSCTRVIRITMFLFGLDLFGEHPWRLDLRTGAKLLALLCSTVFLGMSCMALIVHVIFTLPLLISNSPAYKAIYVWFFQTTSLVTEVSYYGLAYIRKRKFNEFLDQLEETFYDISCPEMAAKWDRRIKVVIIVTNILLLIFGWAIVLHSTYDHDVSSLAYMGINNQSDVLYRIFTFFRHVSAFVFLPFLFFCDILYTVVCYATASLCGSIAMEWQDQSPSNHLAIVWLPETPSLARAGPLQKMVKYHKTLGNLVSDFDAIFAEHMLLSSAVTTGIFLISIKAFLTQQIDTQEYIVFVSHTVFFLLKAIAGSTLNEKIELSIKMRTEKDYQHHCDKKLQSVEEDQKHYMLYLTECTITHAGVTYGGFMPVRKSIILTVAGLVTTYYFIFADHMSKA